MFDRLATSKNIARPTIFACVKQKMIFNFFNNFENIAPQFCLFLLFRYCLMVWPPFQHCLSSIPFVFDELQQLAKLQNFNLATFLSNKACALAISSLLDSNVFERGQTVKHLLSSKFEMLDQQCLIVWPGPNSLKTV